MKFTTIASERPLFVVFDRGDEIIETLRGLARRERIRGGRFAAIGALRHAVIAYWNPESRKYEHIEVTEQVEVASLIGDVTLEGDDTKIHAHVVLGRRDGSTLAGHLIEGHVFPTLEMDLVAFGEPLARRHDAETELSLIAIAETQ